MNAFKQRVSEIVLSYPLLNNDLKWLLEEPRLLNAKKKETKTGSEIQFPWSCLAPTDNVGPSDKPQPPWLPWFFCLLPPP